MIIGFVGLVLFARQYLIFGPSRCCSHHLCRGQLRRQPPAWSIASPSPWRSSALVLLAQWFWEITVVAVLIAGGYIMWENLRELRS
jgi:hypothetical protein